ncbi:MAG: CapA family protein [Vicinamibacterales bacterium]
MSTERRTSRARLALVVFGLCSAVGSTAGQDQAGKPPDDFTMALTGDSIITRRLSVYKEPAFLEMIELVRGADVAFTNLEMLFHDFEPYPMNESGGTYMRGEPALAEELVWAGFDMVARANNHTGDYGAEGMRLTTAHVAKAGLVQAGVGENLAEAREPKFVETAKARVALVAAASTFTDHSRAGHARGGVRGRPGLSPLRFTTSYRLPRERLEQLQAVAKEAGRATTIRDGALTFFNTRFVAGDAPGAVSEPREEDVEEIAAAVRSASKLADYTIVSLHSHESDGDRTAPARFLVEAAHALVDAGADVIVGHGPHRLRGIEIYKGKLILYSLSDFIFQNETLLRLPSENFETYNLGPEAQVSDFNDRRYDNDRRGFPVDREVWESVVAVPRWRGRRLVAVELHPIGLGFGQPAARRGRPMLADGELAQKIIADLSERSKRFGTKIEFSGGIGHVVLEKNVGTGPKHE